MDGVAEKMDMGWMGYIYQYVHKATIKIYCEIIE
jgi:hypothetical protein